MKENTSVLELTVEINYTTRSGFDNQKTQLTHLRFL